MKEFNTFISEISYIDISKNLEELFNIVDEEYYVNYGISYNMINTIRNYYYSTNSYNKIKINNMIDEDIYNIKIIYEMILTIYET